MNTPDFSIVTPSFNQAQFVGRTLESVRRQRGVSVQHVVVDPGSTDGSQDVIRGFAHVHFVQKQDNCQSQGINNGFAECTGRFMAWLNSDDIYPNDDVLLQVKQCFDANPSVDVVYGNATFIDAEGQFIRNYYVNGKATELAESLAWQVGICQPAVFWRRQVYETLGGLDESLDYQLDYEYWIRLCQSGKRWHHLNTVLAAHRWWEGMKTSSRRDLSLRESLNLVKQRFGYVHPKWIQRLAALEVDSSDGIVNVSKGDSAAVARRATTILIQVNTDPATLERLQAADAPSGMSETLDALRAAGVDLTPRVLDARSLKFAEELPRFVFDDDADRPSEARQLRLQRTVPEGTTAPRSQGEDFVVYAVEPNARIAQRLSDFQRAQRALVDYLDACPTGAGRTCVVVANGPSLAKSIDDTLLAQDLIISNFAYKDERLLKHAKFFTIVNHTVAAQVHADWIRLGHLHKFFPFWLGRHVPQLPNTWYVNATVVPEFQADARRCLSWRSTVSYFNLQLAYSLGYRRILLVGFDNSYIQPPSVKEGDEILQKQDDPNHFLKHYFKGKTWQAADAGNMNDSYCEALAFAIAHDVEIINCTVGGHLHVFPRQDLASACAPVAASVYATPGWAALTPGEISLLAHRPALSHLVSSGTQPLRYSSLSATEQKLLLAQARAMSRQVPAPHGLLGA